MTKKTILDDYEKDIEENLGKRELLSDLDSEMELIQKAASSHKKKKKSITIRLSEYDLEAIKVKASKLGIPYQTYINIIIHKDVTSI